MRSKAKASHSKGKARRCKAMQRLGIDLLCYAKALLGSALQSKGNARTAVLGIATAGHRPAEHRKGTARPGRAQQRHGIAQLSLAAAVRRLAPFRTAKAAHR